MARVGIGVPVYNGGPLLRESLECLRTQSFEDFEVAIGDNASSDQTADICADFASRDRRFRHLRRPENIGMTENFQRLRAESRADLFCWRAHDDLSAPNFLERLVRLFDADATICLAVPEIRSDADDRKTQRIVRFRSPPRQPRIARVRHLLFASHASWIYGLWDRKTLGALQDRVHRDYPHAWGWDHLTLLPILLDGTVAGTNETHFVQRILRAGTTRAERVARLPGLAEMRALRKDFERVAMAIVRERSWTGPERAALAALMPFYIDRRGYSRRKLALRSARLKLGIGNQRP